MLQRKQNHNLINKMEAKFTNWSAENATKAYLETLNLVSKSTVTSTSHVQHTI